MRNPFKREHQAIRGFRPDLYVAALFSLNLFDEIWMEKNQGCVPVAGFAAREGFWSTGSIREPRALAEQYRIRVDVPVALPELEKNRRLGSAILCADLPRVAPQLTPDPVSLKQAKSMLKEHGVEEGNFLIACIGVRSGLKLKDWGEENWRKFLETVIPDEGRPIMFLGNPKEAESIERIRSDAYRSRNLCFRPPPIGVSLALASLSSGYVGRDSGVMHMACALGKPVLAAYGGGHWGRFFPSSGPAVVVTQAMSCRMCDFLCHHKRPYCITGITLETMLAGWEALGNIKDVKLLQQPLSDAYEISSNVEANIHAVKRSHCKSVQTTITELYSKFRRLLCGRKKS